MSVPCPGSLLQEGGVTPWERMGSPPGRGWGHPLEEDGVTLWKRMGCMCGCDGKASLDNPPTYPFPLGSKPLNKSFGSVRGQQK